MRWSHAAEIRPVWLPPLTTHTHPHLQINYPALPPSNPPTSKAAARPAVTPQRCHRRINEPLPVVAPGAAVGLLSRVDALVAGQVGLSGGGKAAELALERPLACGSRRQTEHQWKVVRETLSISNSAGEEAVWEILFF